MVRYNIERRKENWQICSTPVQSFVQSFRAVSKEEKIFADAETAV